MRSIKNVSSNRWMLISVLILVMLSINLGCSKQEPDVIKIGVILPLSGRVAMFGEWIKNGIDLGLEDIKKDFTEKDLRIVVIYEDSQNDPKVGISALNKLLTVNRVDLIISAMSKVSIPLIPITEEKNIPLFMQDVTYPNITQRGTRLFRHFIQSDREAKVMADYAIDSLGLISAGILYVNDEAGLGAKESFLFNFSEAGGKIIRSESYEASSTDTKSQIQKMKSDNVEAIYLFGNGPSWAITLKQIRELGYIGAVLTNTAMFIPNFRNLAGNDVIENVYFTYPFMDKSSSSSQKFISLYKKKFNSDPPLESAYAWDIIHIIAESQQSGKVDLYNSLSKIKTFNGAFGTVRFDGQDILTKVGIGLFENGKMVHIQSIE